MGMATDVKETNLAAYLQKDTLVKMMYAYTCGVRKNMPSISKEKCIAQFYKYYNLDETIFIKQSSALRELYRVEENMRQFERTKDHDEPIR